MFLALFCLVSLLTISGQADYTSTWNCVKILEKSVVPTDKAIIWTRWNCTGKGEADTWEPPFHYEWVVGPMEFNIITAQLTSPHVNVLPGLASKTTTKFGLDILPNIAKEVPQAVAGINGGYFWRLDLDFFFDGVCLGKLRSWAEEPASYDCVNCGISDNLIIINGTLEGTNCDLLGNESPVTFIANKTRSSMRILSMGEQLSTRDVQNCLSAGPNLVSWNKEKKESETYIPATDFNVNIWGHTANSAVGLTASDPSSGVYEQLVLATANGYDGCDRSDPTCGIEAYPMAYFMKDFVKSTIAMEMDQGGSTTLWVKGQEYNGVVSNTGKGPVPSPRALNSGLFVTYTP